MSDLWIKAQVAARSARVLLDHGDPDGAVNRAYYASFGAARAVLASIRPRLAISKRHGTIFRRFGKHAVDERGFERALGRSFLLRQRRARQAADYLEGQVEMTMARQVVDEAGSFLAASAAFLAERAAGRRSRQGRQAE
jgi:uncharacterized protein (UPF0332 family)